jgi:hypothetical protein
MPGVWRERGRARKSFNTRIHPLFIVGFLIMVVDLIAAVYWALEIQKP